MNKYSGNLSYEQAKQKVADFVTDYVYQFTALTDKDYLENNTIYLKDIQAIARFFEGVNELEEEIKKYKRIAQEVVNENCKLKSEVYPEIVKLEDRIKQLETDNKVLEQSLWEEGKGKYE